MKLVAVALASLALSSFAACTDAPTDAELAANQQARTQFGHAVGKNYSFTWKYSCFCPDEITAATRVTVRDNLVTAVIDVATQQPVDGEMRGNVSTIDGVFDRIVDEQATDDIVHVTYDAATGNPTFLGVEGAEQAEDDGYGLHISDVVAE